MRGDPGRRAASGLLSASSPHAASPCGMPCGPEQVRARGSMPVTEWHADPGSRFPPCRDAALALDSRALWPTETMTGRLGYASRISRCGQMRRDIVFWMLLELELAKWRARKNGGLTCILDSCRRLLLIDHHSTDGIIDHWAFSSTRTGSDLVHLLPVPAIHAWNARALRANTSWVPVQGAYALWH
jgi:hypothetical protein